MRVLVAIVVLLFAGHAAKAQYAYKTVVAGNSVKLGFFNSTNPDCTSIGFATVRILQNPQQGSLQVSRTRDFPSFPPSNVRHVCNTRRVQGVAITYVAPRGYQGSEYAALEIIYATGSEIRRSYYITVK